MADMADKRIVCIFYKVTSEDFLSNDDGLGPLDGLNAVEITKFESYLHELKSPART